MTPRESLEAAGWHEVSDSSGTFWVRADDPRVYTEAEALARDEAKETSDGGAHNSQTTGGDSGPTGRANPTSVDSSVPAPVATSVSAPESAEQFYAKSAFNFVWYRSNGDIFEFAEAYAREYSSSSSAAPKWDENGILWWAGIGHISVFQRNQDVRKIEAERDALRDSRNRLQEALRAAANHLHYVGQEQAAGQARAALGDPPEGNQHG